jgi:hypothetical protein
VGGSLLGGGGGGDALIGASNAWSAPQTFPALTTARITDADDTGPSASLAVEHRLSAGTPSVGFGSSLEFYGEDETNARTLYGRLHTEGSGFGVAAVDADIALSQSRGGAVVEVLRFDASAGRLEIVDEIWQSAIKRRLRRSAMVVLMQGFSPAGLGADTAEIPVPYDAENGTSNIVWTVRRIDFRVGTAGGAPSIKVQKSAATTAFGAGTDIGTVTLGSGDHEGSLTGPFDSDSVDSGDKLRVNVLALGTATDWSIAVLLESE